ncbi:MAG TPA: acetyl-CoA carboxylase [Chloroflexota bacterium]|nr:acetyl-CoA carboxylase [Chloroflexota bacterium]
MNNPWLDELQQLIQLLNGTSIVELELHEGDLHVAIKRGAAGPEPGVGSPEPEIADNFEYVCAPLLGTFYRSPSPSADVFVKEGDPVEKGQVIGLIEAMKIFNEIQAEVSGRVRAILAADGAFVEADQRLIAIDTHNSEEQPG